MLIPGNYPWQPFDNETVAKKLYSMRLQFTFVLCALLLIIQRAYCCDNDKDCSSHGSCLDKECSCVSTYTGVSCESRWDDVHGSSWIILFYTYCISTAVIDFAVLTVTVIQLVKVFRAKKPTKLILKNVVTQALILTVLGTLFRVLYYTIDPHQMLDIMPTALDNILFDLTILALLPCGFLIMLYWVELQRISGIQELQTITKTRKLLIAFVIFIVIVILPLGILKGFTRKFFALELYNGLVGLTLLFLIIFATVSGVRLMRILRGMYHTSKNQQTNKTFKIFLRKMSYFVIGTSLSLLSVVITLAVFTFFITHAYVYLILHWVMRMEEVSAISFMLLFLSKRRPKEMKSHALDKSNSFSNSTEELEMRVTGGDDTDSHELPG